MAEDVVSRIEARTEIGKRDDETLKEYVERVGEQEGLPPETVEAAVDFVVRHHYAQRQPEDTSPIGDFLAALGGESPRSEPQRPPRRDRTGAGEPDAEVEVPDFELPPSMRPIREEGLAATQGFKGGLRGREPRWLLLWFAIMLATSPILGWLLGRTWVPGTFLYDRAEAALSAILGLSEVAALEAAGAFGLGLYVALLAFFLADVKKRVQGMLLTIGSVLALAGMAWQGVFLPNIPFTESINALALVVGLLLGIAIEFRSLRRLDPEASSLKRPTFRSGDVAEFRLAVYGLFGLVSAIVVVTLGQAVDAETIRVYDVVAAGLFLVMTYRFVQYESETTYVTLGPAKAGKSMLMIGLVLELLETDGPHPQPNDYLQEGLERVSNLQPGNERWPVPSTPPDELEVSAFEVIVGYYFPRRLELTALDYAGQHLERIAELIDHGVDNLQPESVPARVALWIGDSDTLIVLLDVERLVRPGEFTDAPVGEDESISWGLEYYTTILDRHDPDDAIVVATKCDLLVHEGHVDPPVQFASFEAYREAVTNHLSARPDVAELLTHAEESTIHPVFFATRRRDGTFVPRLDGRGNLMPVGFGHLVEEFRRRQ